jgi:putative nucleotidyltransferase with HDIG domain
MDESTARQTVNQVFSLILAQGSTDYLGERISQLSHSLQAAALAQQANADEDTILGALLHDIGRFIPAAEKMESMVTADGTYVGKASHEVVGEEYLRGMGFSEKICALVGAHVVAKRFLCAVEEGYWEDLSGSSKATLRFQVSGVLCCAALPFRC